MQAAGARRVSVECRLMQGKKKSRADTHDVVVFRAALIHHDD